MGDATADSAAKPDSARTPAIVVALLTVLVQLPIFDRWFSVMDEGHMLLFADLVTKGQQLYSDMTIYPLPGAFYLLAAAFELFDPSILVSRWLVVVEFAVLVATAFWLISRIASIRYAAFAVFVLWIYRVWAFPHWQMFNYSSTALVFLFGSLATLVAYFESGRTRTLWTAGLLYGLGVFCKQDYGAATGIAAGVALFAQSADTRQRLRALAHFLWPAASVGALAGLHFWMQGQLDFVVQMTVLKHFVGLSTYEYQAFPPLLPIFSQDPTLRDVAGIYNFFPSIVSTADGDAVLRSAWFRETSWYDTAVKLYIYAPIPFVLAGLLRCAIRRRKAGDPATRVAYLGELVLTVFAAAVVGLAHVYRPQDYVHFAVLYWPMLLLAIVYAHAMLHGRTRLTWAVAALLLVPVGATAAYTGRLVVQFREMFSEPLDGERAGIYARPEQVRMLRELVDYMRDRSEAEEPIAVLPYFSIAHFLADRHGPHAASYIVWPFPEYPDRDQRIVDAMEALGTRTVIYTHTQFPNFPAVSEYAPVLYDYLVEHYETERTFADDPLGFKLAALQRSLPDPSSALKPGGVSLHLERPDGTRTPIRSRQAGYFDATTWPFRPVWALRPTANGRTLASLPLDVPADATLVTAIGVHPDAWFDYPGTWVRFTIHAVIDGRRTELLDRTLDPHQTLTDRGWFDVALPLDAFAKHRITLEFGTQTATANGQRLEMGGFGAPRIRKGPQ